MTCAGRRQPDMGYLRIDTSPYGEKSDKVQQQAGLLTPISAACDGRKSSIASSSWSFVSSNSDVLTHSSNVTSIRSSREPSTPPPHGLQINMPFMFSDSSFEGLSPIQDYGVTKQSMVSTPGAVSYTPSHLRQFQPQDGYVYISDHGLSQSTRFPLVGLDTMMPASGDFHTAIGVGLPHLGSEGVDYMSRQHNGCRRDWFVSKFEQYLPATRAASPTYPGAFVTEDDPFTWMGSALSPSSPAHNQLEPYIVPTEMDIDRRDSFCIIPSQDDADIPTTPSNGFGKRTNDDDLLVIQDEPNYGPISPTPDSAARLVRRLMQAKRSGKRSKAHHRRRAEKRGDHAMEAYMPTRNGARIPVRCSPKKKKQFCEHCRREGKDCGFDRIEHLRRHELIHRGEKPHSCVLTTAELGEKYHCERPFGRRDNLRDHYKTHLRQTKSGRNGRCSWRVLCETLRIKEVPEEAEKTIQMLQKWLQKQDRTEED